MKQNKLDALSALRLEKEVLREECTESETNLVMHWEYVRDNVGSLLLSSAISSTRRKLGFGSKKAKAKTDSSIDNENIKSDSKGIFQIVTGGLFAISPFIWDIVQPALINFVMKKVKSIFSSKKK